MPLQGAALQIFLGAHMGATFTNKTGNLRSQNHTVV